jgi:hypothetical protein
VELNRVSQFLINLETKEGETWSLVEALFMFRFSNSIILSMAATKSISLLDV